MQSLTQIPIAYSGISMQKHGLSPMGLNSHWDLPHAKNRHIYVVIMASIG